jgi:hypothetical protein
MHVQENKLAAPWKLAIHFCQMLRDVNPSTNTFSEGFLSTSLEQMGE